jgi:hypothetical protein
MAYASDFADWLKFDGITEHSHDNFAIGQAVTTFDFSYAFKKTHVVCDASTIFVC